MERGIGEFVIEATPLASITGGVLDDAVTECVNKAYAIGKQRTVHQDAAYGIRQLVDIALKALSPGINDTTTAISCLDYLGAILARLADRSIESPYRTDGDRIRLVTRGPTFALLLAEALDQIRQNAEGNVAILSRMLEVLEVVAGRITDPIRNDAIRQHATLVTELAERSVPAAHDRASVLAIGERLRERLNRMR